MLMEYTDSLTLGYLEQTTRASNLAMRSATLLSQVRCGSTLTWMISTVDLAALHFSLRVIRRAANLILKEVAYLEAELEKFTTNSTLSSAPNSKKEE